MKGLGDSPKKWSQNWYFAVFTQATKLTTRQDPFEGSAARGGTPPNIDLNSLMLEGRIQLDPPAISRMVTSRWLALTQDFAKRSRENSSDSLVARPMPKGGKHEIT